MSAAIAETVSCSERQETVRARIAERIRVFAEYCLLREATTTYFRLVFPLVALAFLIITRQAMGMSVGNSSGFVIFCQLLVPVTFFICFNAAQHISSAISWEISLDMRDLVRLTDINPVVLLWCRTLPRIWTTFLSALMFLPLLAYARTHGGVTNIQWLAAGSWMLLILCLVTGFAMLAGVVAHKGATTEATAASTTFVLGLIYHLLFWVPAATILISGWVMNSMNRLPGTSFSWILATAILDYSPVVLFYRNAYDPAGFSFVAPEFWIHFLTALGCVLLSVRVARNRFRVTTQGDADEALLEKNTKTNTVRLVPIPRCTDQPFLWKDLYILGTTDRGGGWFWFGFSCLILHGVFTAVFYQLTYVSTIGTMILVPCMVAARFDALLDVEIREKTFDSLIILPVNPWSIIVSKIQVAFWCRRWLLLPLLVTAALSATYSLGLVGLGFAFALLSTLLLFEIALVNKLTRQYWVVGLTIAVLFVGMLAADLIAFNIWRFEAAIALSASLLLAGISICHCYNNRLLRNWAAA